MNETSEGKASCLCGAVIITLNRISCQVGACHCSVCQKWSGGPFMTVECGSEVSVEGEQYITLFNSSEWAERGFCNQCGTHLYYHLKEANQYMMPVGLIDTDISFNFDHQIFIESKPSYYCFANQTKEMTGEEAFAQYAPPSK